MDTTNPKSPANLPLKFWIIFIFALMLSVPITYAVGSALHESPQERVQRLETQYKTTDNLFHNASRNFDLAKQMLLDAHDTRIDARANLSRAKVSLLMESENYDQSEVERLTSLIEGSQMTKEGFQAQMEHACVFIQE